MADAAALPGGEVPVRRRRRWRWATELAKLFLALLIAAMLGAAAFIAFLNTDAGRRFILDQISSYSPESGFRVRIGRIEGSIWGDTKLRDVRLYDPQGLFAEAPLVEMDWQPAAWLTNRLLIHDISTDLAILHRLPEFHPAEEPRPILPDFGIHIGRFDIKQLRIGDSVTGTERTARLSGEAEIRKRRALVALDAVVAGGGDALALRLDAEPDRDRFDLDARLRAPADSVAGAIIGTRRPIDLAISGDGSWSNWMGTARLNLSGRRAAELSLRANDGTYRAQGAAVPSQFLEGRVAQLTGPRMRVNAQGTLKDRLIDGQLSLRSSSLRMEGRGGIDLSRSSYRNVRLGVDLLRPAALFSNMRGERVRLTGTLNGAFRGADYAYRLAAPRILFDHTGFDQVQAQGSGRLSRWPVTVPILATARRVTGVGETAEDILANLRVQGRLQLTERRLGGRDLAVASDRLRGTLGLDVDLRTGLYDASFRGGMERYPVEGLGITDVETAFRAASGAGGRGVTISGSGSARLQRFDNEFLRGLAGGLPRIDTSFSRGPDGIFRFTGLRVTGPEIRVAGEGYRRRDGTFVFIGSGSQDVYGPVALTLDGPIERPHLALRLARPNDALGLADVRLNLDPDRNGFHYRAEGRSHLGLFTSRGAILLPRGERAVIDIAALNVSSTSASGRLRSDPGGFSGRLVIAGGGLDGALVFSPAEGVQRIEAQLRAQNAVFSGSPAVRIANGRVDGIILLDPKGTSLQGSLSARGLNRGGLSLASLEAEAEMRGGAGQVRATLAGTRGRSFAFNAVADIVPDRIQLTGSGMLDRRPIALSQPALLTKTGDGWRLAPAAIGFAGGSAAVSGLFGGQATLFEARVDSLPLTMMDIVWPELGLGGVATGRLSYSEPASGQPSGDADLRIRGLTRSGVVLASSPVDIGVVARMADGSAAMRAVAVSGGNTIGRAQARLSPIGRSGSLSDRLGNAPLVAQLRYNGPADTLWRLTGVDLIDITGPVAIGADAAGTLNDPRIKGSLQTDRARLESPVTGTIIQNIAARGRFDGSQLLIESFSGSTAGGAVSGSGSFDLAAARGYPMDVTVAVRNALLIDRDDLRAQLTGPLRIRSNGNGGTIGGNVELVSGSFRLGSATAAGEVPRLNVREINRRETDAPARRAGNAPWRLDLGVRSSEGLRVTGLGMNSYWGTDIRVRGNVTEPRIDGTATLARGTYDFAGRRFDLSRGTMLFQGRVPIDPQLDIVAEGTTRGLNAQIRVTGRSQRPEIAFTSTPALPQDEVLSRLLFGTSIANLSAPEALQLATAVAALNNPEGGLDPINAVRSAVGLDRLRILPADIVTGQGTAIAAGKYIGRDVYVEVVTDARGYSATMIEYQITRWLSLLSSISTIGRESVNLRVSRDY
jgi:translocation and assembly module TamB